MRRQNTQVVPEHLQPFVATQYPELYTPIDHASWRFILKLSREFFARHAHEKYLKGLELTGIHLERIPLISEMDEKVAKFGWHAVPVVGFIPPQVFLEFLSLGILPIACDMRTLEHLAYTPAPDIVHEAAGHAPILADPEYAKYLLHYGELARKVIFSDKDMAVYDAIRELSDTKENPASTPEDITRAQKRLDETLASVDYVSEATQLSRMGWWTFEYGLVGPLENPKIYGAGLLSSVGESFHCLSDKVKKIPMSLECIEYSYDITRPQPQLFVTPDFQTLRDILDAFSKKMAFNLGGFEALQRGQRSRTVTTTVLDSGLQLSGKIFEIGCDKNGTPSFLKFEGPVQLAKEDLELKGHGADYHAQGYSTPLGKFKTFEHDHITTVTFESGIEVVGKLKSKSDLLYTFEDCTVRQGDRILFDPSWGTFDMAVGEKVVSVFGGAADRAKYLHKTGGYKQHPTRQKTNLTEANRELCDYYDEVRKLREQVADDPSRVSKLSKALEKIHTSLDLKYPGDWLLRYELLELDHHYGLHAPWADAIEFRLDEIAVSSKEKREMITRGKNLLKS